MQLQKFDSLFSERNQDAGWCVVQASTLLHAALEHRSTSFVIYAALELRMAIEQLVFTIIAVAKGGINTETAAECRKKDALFRILNEVLPKYSLRCRFQSAAAAAIPGIPALSEWDVKSLLRNYTGLSGLCHSQLIIVPFDSSSGEWHKHIEYLLEVYEFLASGLSKPTAVMHFTDAKISIADLWELYSTGQITLDDVKLRLKERNPNPSPVLKTQKRIVFETTSHESAPDEGLDKTPEPS